jgi:MEMO1 family protein
MEVRRSWKMALPVACFNALLAAAPMLPCAARQKIREPAVAGGFYPADPQALSALLDDLLAQAQPCSIDGAILAAVAPHAGYPYSGPVAAFTFAALRARRYSRVVVIAPSHYAAFGFSSVYDGDAYATPLGAVPIDKDFALQLTKMNGAIQLSGKGHESTAAGGEHAIEVELPWLQRMLGHFELVPIVMGDQRYESSRALGVALAKLITKSDNGETLGDTLILASSDLSHYHSCADAEAMDHNTLRALEAWDYFSMARNFGEHVWEACGGGPVVAAMIAAERMGANQAVALDYATSGDTSGDRSRVVGYSADLFVKSAHPATELPPFSLTGAEKAELLALARNSVESVVRQKELYLPPLSASETLNREYGAFVTLTKAGALRGCVGYAAALKPLSITVRDTASLAAVRDPRFPPVAPAELPDLAYEISVLSPLRRVAAVEQIEVGRDGLLVKNGNHEGLLLPQVASEHHWDRQRFVEGTCVKAGLAPDGWKDDATDLFRFTAVVFGRHAEAPRNEGEMAASSRTG